MLKNKIKQQFKIIAYKIIMKQKFKLIKLKILTHKNKKISK